MLLSLLERYVCLSMTELIQLSGLAEGTIRHHMRHLIKADMVTSTASGRHRYFFPNGGLRAHWNAIILLQCPQNRQIVETIAAFPGLDQQRVAQAVGLSQGRVCIRLQSLAGEGLVDAIRDGRRMRYYSARQTDRQGRNAVNADWQARGQFMSVTLQELYPEGVNAE